MSRVRQPTQLVDADEHTFSARSGVAASALRFYETQGLITAERTPGHQRRYPRHMIRRVAFIRAAQRVGLSLDEIGQALQRLKAKLTGCVGCGCLSLRTCPLNNPDDEQGATAPGPAWLSTDENTEARAQARRRPKGPGDAGGAAEGT